MYIIVCKLNSILLKDLWFFLFVNYIKMFVCIFCVLG